MTLSIAIALAVLALPAPAPPPAAERYTKNVAILLYDGVEVLDFTGPAEVFAAASGFGAKGSERAFNLYTVSRRKAPIVSQGFLHVTPDYSIEDAPKPDILVLPGGGSSVVSNDAAWMGWIQGAGHDADHVLTVCTGAFLAGHAGLLDGLEATTWYQAVPRLKEQFPKTTVQPGRRFVDSGRVITTAGVSAGIDGSLHLVARLLGRYVADRTAEYMEYRWAPESYHSSRYPEMNPRLDAHGRVLQRASISLREGDAAAAISAYRSLIAQDPSDAEAWLSMGRALHGLKRYAEAITAHLEAAKGPSQRGAALYNLSCEYALMGDREKAIEAASGAVNAGVRVKGLYLGDDDLTSIRGDPRFQALLAGL